MSVYLSLLSSSCATVLSFIGNTCQNVSGKPLLLLSVSMVFLSLSVSILSRLLARQ